VDSVCL
jgi:hypothetical protein